MSCVWVFLPEQSSCDVKGIFKGLNSFRIVSHVMKSAAMVQIAFK